MREIVKIIIKWLNFIIYTNRGTKPTSKPQLQTHSPPHPSIMDTRFALSWFFFFVFSQEATFIHQMVLNYRALLEELMEVALPLIPIPLCILVLGVHSILIKSSSWEWNMEALDCNFNSLLDLWDCCTRAERIPPVVSFCFLCHFHFGFFFPILIIPFGLVDVCMCSDLIWVVKWSGKFLLFMPFLF